MTKLRLASKARIDIFESTAIEFFSTVLDVPYRECIVTDESWLGDFASCGLPDHLADTTRSLTELWQAWDDWIGPFVCSHYCIGEVSSAVLLVDLFEQIEAARRLDPR